jgi:hypothetical protein
MIEQGVVLRGGGDVQPVLEHADGQAADDVDEHDDDAGDRIPAHELAGAVHRAVELGLLADLAAAPAGIGLPDQAGVQVRVDRHLLARHGVQGEARRNLGDAAGALGDDHEVDDHQDDEHNDPDYVVVAYQEVAERLDHLAGRVRAIVAVEQHHAGGGHVQRQPQQRGDQQDRGEQREVQRLQHVQRHQQDQHGHRDVEGEQQVQRDGGQRQHHHRQDHDDEQRRGHLPQGRPGDLGCLRFSHYSNTSTQRREGARAQRNT